MQIVSINNQTPGRDPVYDKLRDAFKSPLPAKCDLVHDHHGSGCYTHSPVRDHTHHFQIRTFDGYLSQSKEEALEKHHSRIQAQQVQAIKQSVNERAKRFLFKRGKAKFGTMVLNEKRRAQERASDNISKQSKDESVQIVNLQRDQSGS